MVQAIQFNAEALNPFGGLSGFGQGNRLDGPDRPLAGLLRPGGPLGQRQNSLNSLGLSNPLLQQIEDQRKKTLAEQDKEEDKDRVELSDFVEEAAEKAVEEAKGNKPGVTNQVFVSEDGRFEVSIDLLVRSDGSYDLDLEVGFAQSQAFAIESAQFGVGAPEGETADFEDNLDSQLTRSTSALYERYTSYEQVLQTRDFEARIFFEESKSVAASASQAFGPESGQKVLTAANQVSNEFKLNVQISGADINNFNQVAEELIQFDDTGTLSGFLDAVGGVLNADSSNLGSFLEATQSLVDASKNHISSKLSGFFNSFNEQFGQDLEEVGFEKDFLANVGEDVQNDLNTFFDLTQQFLGALSGGNNLIDNAPSKEESELSVLEQSVEQLKQEREEILQGKDEGNPLFDSGLDDEPGVIE